MIKSLVHFLELKYYRSSVCDYNEAYQCLSELFHPATISVFVNVAYDHVLEGPNKSKENVGKLLSELVRYGSTVFLPLFVPVIFLSCPYSGNCTSFLSHIKLRRYLFLIQKKSFFVGFRF